MTPYVHVPLVVLAVAASACASDEPQHDASGNGTAQSSTDTTKGAQELPEPPRLQSGGTTDQVQAQMEVMQRALKDTVKAMLPMHRQMAATMIAAFNREILESNLSGDAAWIATVDSLRQDLVRMPGMSTEGLWFFFPEHGARLNRLMEMHRSMMSGMAM